MGVGGEVRGAEGRAGKARKSIYTGRGMPISVNCFVWGSAVREGCVLTYGRL